MSGHRVEAFYAFLVRDDDDDEAVPAFRTANGMMLPLVGSDQVRVESLRRVAQDIATATGKTLTLVKFTTRENIEDIKP